MSVPSESYYLEHDTPEIHPTSPIVKNGSLSQRNQSVFTEENLFNDADVTETSSLVGPQEQMQMTVAAATATMLSQEVAPEMISVQANLLKEA